MKFKQSLLTTAAAATALFGMASAPAQAFNFGNGGITFDADTTVDFNFMESHGYYKGKLGVFGPGGTKTYLGINENNFSDAGNAGEWKGTCGVTVTTCTDAFTFKAGETYSLFLESWGATRLNTTVYSTTAKNTGSQVVNGASYNFGQQVKFFDDLTLLNDPKISNGSLGSNGSLNSKLVTTAGLANADPFAKTILMAFEDQGQGVHTDYNDFLVTAKARTPVASVPEPATLAGLGLVAGALAFSRNRRRRASQFS
ncbi:PEP-CTERM sorting domain-containing protein [Argonema antarcticum]|uniref:PEP-CTERM sorting domain-containing protein n=1 Tax=Argonema antarcticum TaxID=2942763 RepID=UPI002010E441|nr:PEP-CTERM sorting domain-containing protein [Argonema antarcticum]MCL1469353.1 PEP-CTERM sorting domain-containing protein [Argonema antarcticum A004/B2]